MRDLIPLNQQDFPKWRKSIPSIRTILCFACIPMILMVAFATEVIAVSDRSSIDSARMNAEIKESFKALTSRQADNRDHYIQQSNIYRQSHIDMAMEVLTDEKNTWQVRSDAAKLLGVLRAVEAAPKLLTTATEFSSDPENIDNLAVEGFYCAMQEIGYGMLPACLQHIRSAETELDIRVSVLVYSIAMPTDALNVDRKEHLLYLLDRSKSNSSDEVEIKNLATAIEYTNGFLK